MLLCAGTKILLRQPNFIHFCCFITFNIIFGQEVYLHICYEISVLLNISHCTVNMCIIMFSTLCVWMFTLIISLWDWNSVVKKTFSVEWNFISYVFFRYFSKLARKRKMTWMNSWRISSRRELLDWEQYLDHQILSLMKAYMTRIKKSKLWKTFLYPKWNSICE